MGLFGGVGLGVSLGDSLVSHSVPLGGGLGRQMTVSSGRRCLGLLERLGRPTSLLRMLVGSSRWGAGIYSGAYSLTWRERAIGTSRSGVERGVVSRWYCRLLVSARPTGGTGLSLLPTLVSNDGKKGGRLAPRKRNGVSGVVANLLPTVTAGDWKGDWKGETAFTNQPSLPNALGASGGKKLQPAFAEWMMGFPPGWTELEAYPPLPRKKGGRMRGGSGE